MSIKGVDGIRGRLKDREGENKEDMNGRVLRHFFILTHQKKKSIKTCRDLLIKS
jgi:hypothetical protein